MRVLNKKQKDILDQHNVKSVNDLDYKVYQELIDIHDFELIYQETDRYLQEKYDYNLTDYN